MLKAKYLDKATNKPISLWEAMCIYYEQLGKSEPKSPDVIIEYLIKEGRIEPCEN